VIWFLAATKIAVTSFLAGLACAPATGWWLLVRASSHKVAPLSRRFNFRAGALVIVATATDKKIPSQNRMVMSMHSFYQLQSANRSIASIALGSMTHWPTFHGQGHKSTGLAPFQSMRKGHGW
jgi:hypothetical protein